MGKRKFKTESKRLMDMMINSIYTHKEIFLREIISNSSDALDKLRFISLTDEKVRDKMGELQIEIKIDKDNRLITVSDNGIGMSKEDLEENLGTIAKSGSLQFKENLKEDEKSDIIGQFGVGFYSAFMVSDEVEVITKRYDSEDAYSWKSSGVDGYTVELSEKESMGTDVIMHIKEDVDEESYSEFLESYRIQGIIKKYSDYVRFPIKMEVEKSVNTAKEGEDAKYETVKEVETLNSMRPIWQKSKSEVSDEECANYYKEHFHDYSDPAAVIRVSTEGTVSYKAMLFIPSQVPAGYYTKEFEKGLQLYSSGVMIMDKCDMLLPEHFRFVKGIIDSQDLSLNISRETLQNDRQLTAIAKNIEKKIKSELKKMLKNDFEKYKEFWKNFGVQIKYGIVNSYGQNRELLEDLLVFPSSISDAPVTLEQYADTMKEDQKYIYFVSGKDKEQLSKLPQAELCKEKGYEMLYFTDEIDEFLVQSLMQYKEKQFKSVTAQDSELQSDEEKEKSQKETEENKELLDFIKEKLADKIEKAVVSQNLGTHPVSLSAQGAISLEMEKYFSSIPDTGMGTPKASKVLELNPESKAFISLKKAFENDKDKAEKYAKILFDQSLLIAGFPIEDPVEYTKLVCELMD